LSGLGPEPLERAFTAEILRERARNRKTPVKVFIMDQRVVVGVGNIYASEALFAAGVDPCRAAGSLAPEEWARVVARIKSVLRSAVKKGGSSIRDYAAVDGSEGAFQRCLKVYGRAGETCPRCLATIISTRQGGRSTFFCPECQR
jgi:formamidopyrimidine-DNA glycosylase